jgi:putative heme-binding domain-containing protein
LLPPNQRRHTLGTDINPQIVLALKGDAARGKALFNQEGGAQCSRCHQLEGQGRNFGPDLSNVSRKYTRALILEQIIFPSKIIVPEFKTFTVTLRDDAEWTGFIVKRTGTELVLRDENLVEHTIKLSDIKDTHESAISAMPEGLLAPLTAQEAADVLEYLSQLKPVAAR